MPFLYKRYVVDFDGSGYVNLSESVDSIRNIDNYFKAHGCIKGGSVVVQAYHQAPGLNYGFKTRYPIDKFSAASLSLQRLLGNNHQASLLRLAIGPGY